MKGKVNVISINLPWPSIKLSPNISQHWARLSEAKKSYKTECFLSTMHQIYYNTNFNSCNGQEKYDRYNGLDIDITFYPPQNRRYDRDNLVARMKSGLDGMCQAMKIDDSIFKCITARVGQKKEGGSVLVVITKSE
jgi:hypothetical protein